MKESFLLPLIVIFLLGSIHLGMPSFAAEPVEKKEDKGNKGKEGGLIHKLSPVKINYPCHFLRETFF